MDSDSPATSASTAHSPSVPRQFKAGEFLFLQGQAPLGMYILQEGRLGVIEDGVHIATISDPGSYVGELSLILRTQRLADIQAETDCSLLFIEDVSTFFREDTDRALELVQVLAQRLMDMDRKFLEMRELAKKQGNDVSKDEPKMWPEELMRFRQYLHAIKQDQ